MMLVVRTNEIGVRVALGASRTGILRMIRVEGMLLTLGEIVVGVPVALIGAQFLADRLFGVSATVVPTFIAASLGMIAVATAAGLIPARCAASVDPMVALRQ